MKKIKILSFLFLTSFICLHAQVSIKNGDIAFASNFNNKSGRDIWSKNNNASWVKEGIAGNTCLVIEGKSAMIKTVINLKPYRGMELLFKCLAKAENVTKPAHPYDGVKYMLNYTSTTGDLWKNENNVYGSFDWKELSFVAAIPNDVSEGNLYLGFNDCSGKVWFDSVIVEVVMAPPSSAKVIEDSYLTTRAKYRFRGSDSNFPLKDDNFRALGVDWNANILRWHLDNNWTQAKSIEDNNFEQYDSWLDGEMKELDTVVSECKKYGIKVVINLFSPPGGCDSTGVMRMFYDKKCNDHFIKTWETISQRFKNNSVIWGYDLVNEPLDQPLPIDEMDCYNTQVKAANAIRNIDTKTPIIIEAGVGDSPLGFIVFSPLEIKNVIYSVHMYTPISYTHQGVFDSTSGIVYPGTISGKYYDKDTLRAILQPVRDFQLKYNVQIYVGEFSAVRWAPGAAQYISDCIDIFEEYGWDWTYHAFRESTIWDVEYESGSKLATPKKSIQDTDRKKTLLNNFSKNEKH